MSLACQKNSYLKKIETNIKSFVSINNSKENFFEVILEDSILFPEGGGQPCDHGLINNLPVVRVFRRGTEAVHVMHEAPFKESQNVVVEVDWKRRWDHMQQHSAQHLLSSLLETLFNFNTTSWNLGLSVSSIELDTKEISHSQIEELESIANQKIKDGLKMYPVLYTDKNDPAVQEAKCRGLPLDHEGPVRLVVIEGTDNNLCCGTHVSNLSHLQTIKILDVEKGKKDKVNLIFISGDRILKYISNSHTKEKSLTSLLKGGPEEHLQLIQKIQSSLKMAQKTSTTLLKDVVKYEARLFLSQQPRPNHYFLHKKEGNNEFMNWLSLEIGDDDVLVFISVGEEKGPGLFLVTGKPQILKQIYSKMIEILDAKAVLKDNRFQGKANKIQERTKAELLILEHLQ